MNKHREIILSEIEYWRKNRLLPAAYCDFLANLYSEAVNQSAEQVEPKSAKWRRVLITGLVVGLGALLLVAAYIWFRVDVWTHMELVCGAAAIIGLIGLLRSGHSMVRFAWCSASALLFLFAGVIGYPGSMTMSYGQEILLFCIFLLWLGLGMGSSSRILAGAGWIGILVVVEKFTASAAYMGQNAYGWQTLFWSIPFLAGLGLAYLCGRKQFYVSPVFLVLSALPFLAPEIQMLFMPAQQSFLIDFILFLKVAVLVSVFIVFRQSIQSWWLRQSK